MSSDGTGPDPAKGLPPVVPPSGRFIAQLFLVPGLIVAGAVIVLLGFSWLAGGPRTADAFLRDLDSPNTDIRWRTTISNQLCVEASPGTGIWPERQIERNASWTTSSAAPRSPTMRWASEYAAPPWRS